MLALTEHHIGDALVHIHHHGAYLGMPLAQFLYERFAAGEAVTRADESHEHLSCEVADADKDIAQEAFACVLVVGANLEAFAELRNGDKDGFCALVFHEAGVARDDAMAALCKEAVAHAALWSGSKGDEYLVAAVQRHIHPDNGGDGGDVCSSKQLLDHRLLALQLDGVGYGQPLAAAAALGYLACVCLISHVHRVSQACAGGVLGNE